MAEMKTIVPTLITALALVGCNNDSSTSSKSKQIKTIEVYEQGVESKLTQTKQYRFEYQQGRLAQVNTYGTDPQKRVGHVFCGYQGKISQPVIDLEQQTVLGTGWQQSPTDQILATLLGIDQSTSLCKFDLQDDAVMTQTEYVDKIDANIPFVVYTWSATQQNAQAVTGFSAVVDRGLTSPTDCASSSTGCDVQQRDVGNTITRFVQINQHLLADTINHQLYAYDFENQNIKTKTIYQYTGDDLSQLATQLEQLTVLDQIQYRYTTNQVQRCGRLSQEIDFLNQQQWVERQILGAGADDVACTVDDVVVRQEKFSY
jgi:uncharacterized lipoprotein NlpE involved in copper resistance